MYSSPARPGVYSPTAHVNNRPVPMGSAYRMMENGQPADMVGPPLAKQARSQAPTSSVYEVNYEISVWRQDWSPFFLIPPVREWNGIFHDAKHEKKINWHQVKKRR